MAKAIVRYLSCAMFLAVAMAMTLQTERTTFKAAVYEHAFVAPPVTQNAVSRSQALSYMQVNLDVYKTQAAKAKQQGVDILVFPENGLYGYIFTRQTIRPYLEYIPDPDEISWSACDDPNRFPNTEVQRQLSCMAKSNSIYLVADMGDLQKCESSDDPKCPPDGAYQYNTAVAFDPTGKLVARYHKRNLFHEEQFDRPEAKVKYFDTPFGRFGLFVCFDILYKSPAIDMVKEHNIRNVVFPTAWMDALPLLSAIGWHSSFARGQGVNLLAANLHRPSIRVQGSGIYTPNGMASFYYDRLTKSGPKLIVKEIDVIDLGTQPATELQQSVDVDKRFLVDPSLLMNDINQKDTPSFENKGYTFIQLKANAGKVSVCQKQVCCSLDYSFLDHPKTEMMVLGAFDGLYHGKYYSQICAVLKCPKDDKKKCGSYTFFSGSSFARAKLQATNSLGSSSVFPQVVVSKDGQLKLTDASAWTWSLKDMTLNIEQPLKTPLLTMAIVTRHYSKDPQKH